MLYHQVWILVLEIGDNSYYLLRYRIILHLAHSSYKIRYWTYDSSHLLTTSVRYIHMQIALFLASKVDYYSLWLLVIYVSLYNEGKTEDISLSEEHLVTSLGIERYCII